ncbi:unnamed protein product [Diamesa hyperborea]
MANMAISRIKREFKEVLKSEEIALCSIKLEMVNDCFTELIGEIAGPPDTPYEYGTFVLEIKVPESYPFNPPRVKFVTKIWHPNISSVTGAICLDILKDNWAAAMTLRTVLLSLQALLSQAEPDDPQDAVVASQYKENHDMFILTAKHWTNVYAKGKTKLRLHHKDQFLIHLFLSGPHKFTDCDNKIQRLKDMGINEYDARAQLSRHNWNLERATEQLFS